MITIPTAFLKDLFVPRANLKFALAGSGIGMFGDVIDFFTSFVDRKVLLAGLIVFAAGTFYMCWKLVFRAPQLAQGKAAASTDCPECNATRFGLFAALAFAILSWIGQGESATAKIGDQLGLIQRDVAIIKEVLEPQTIIDNPKSMPDHFNNAYVYLHYRNDSAAAMREMRTLYALGAPGKINSAQIYFDAHAAQEGRAQTLARMEKLATERGDATLLVIAARNTNDPGGRSRLVARAREMAPDMPFAWWDPMLMPDPGPPGLAFTNPGAEAARLRGVVARMEKFDALSAAAPPTRWFYMPESAAHYSGSMAMLADQFRKSAQMYEDMESGKFQREIREKLVRERAKGI